MHPDALRGIELLSGLDGAQLAAFASLAEEVPFDEGDVLFREADHADAWWMLLEGVVVLSRHVGTEEVVVARMDVPGRWAGGFRAWDDEGVYLATGRALGAGRVLRLASTDLRDWLAHWFPFGSHLVEGLYRTARSVESTARQRDALVTLGTLAAGLAHEINNPAAAAIRAVDALSQTRGDLLASLTGLASAGTSSEQFTRLDALREDGEGRLPVADALARSDSEDELAGWLAERDVDDPWGLAAELGAAGVDVPWCEQVAAALPGAALGPGLRWIAATYTTDSLLGEAAESTRRIFDLISAVRGYSRMDQASRQRTVVREGIESTLTMLGHKLGGVTVVRDYDEVEPIDAYAGELNQVWTNLIDNAVDAMDGVGTLTISLHDEDEHLVVTVGDTGPGIPPEVVARVFEPFFTTKEPGRGTGLGLDIARRIVVERHGGTITIEPSDAGTRVVVRLSRELPDA